MLALPSTFTSLKYFVSHSVPRPAPKSHLALPSKRLPAPDLECRILHVLYLCEGNFSKGFREVHCWRVAIFLFISEPINHLTDALRPDGELNSPADSREIDHLTNIYSAHQAMKENEP